MKECDLMNKIIIILLFIVIAIPFSSNVNVFAEDNPVSVWNGGIATGFTEGDGSTLNPYKIYTANELAFLAQRINASDTDYRSKAYILMSDIDLNNKEWTPIGCRDVVSSTIYFSGDFNGNNKKISNIQVLIEKYNIGLFGYLSGAKISNLTITSGIIGNVSSVTSSKNFSVGGIAGAISNSLIDNCTNYAWIKGNNYIGGIVGQNSGTITNCANYGKAESIGCHKRENQTAVSVGGIAGSNSGTIYNCSNSGEIIGYLSCTLYYPNQCYSYNFEPGCSYAGGIAGTSSNIIRGSYNVGNVSSKTRCSNSSAYSGGLVGNNTVSDMLANSYNIGSVISQIETLGASKVADGICNNKTTNMNCHWLDIANDTATTGQGTKYTNVADMYLLADLLNNGLTEKTFENIIDKTPMLLFQLKKIIFHSNSNVNLKIDKYAEENGQIALFGNEVFDYPGYTLLGWDTDKNAVTPQYQLNQIIDMPKDGTVFYAIWQDKPKATIIFNSNNGTGKENNIIANETSIIILPNDINISRAGYSFLGWSSDSNSTTPMYLSNQSFIMPVGGITLYAIWSINSYTVSFDTKDGSSINSQTVQYNGLISRPNNPSKSGYAFAGWYKESSLSAVWNFAIDKMPANNITLYAKWDLLPIITFDRISGTYNQVFNLTITPNIPTATIYYTIDGSTPTTSSLIYSAPILIDKTTTVKSFAKYTNYTSSISTNTYTIIPILTFSKSGGNYATPISVELTANIEESSIYYTLDGSTPTILSTKYTEPINIFKNTTLKAMCVYKGSSTSVTTYSYTFPSSVVNSNKSTLTHYTSSFDVVLTTGASWYEIYYSLDGSDPTINGVLYSSPIRISKPLVLKAVAKYNNTVIGNINTFTYNFTLILTNKQSPGSYTTPISIELTANLEGSSIYYTLDGSTPTISSAQYTEPINIFKNTTLKALCIYNGLNTSASYSYTFPSPVINSDKSTSSNYTSPFDIILTTGASWYEIYYSLDGSDPAINGVLYSSPIRISKPLELKAVAKYNNIVIGSINTLTYKFTPTLTNTQSSGSYSTPFYVELLPNTEDTTIYYTLDGSTPTTSSTIYSIPISIYKTTTIKAIVKNTNYTSSAYTWTYTLP